MKKQILSEEFKRMQKLAGILNESTLFPPNSISDFGNKHFDEIQNMFGKIRSEFQGTKTKGIEVAFAGSDEDDGIDISFDPKFKKMSDVYNEIEPVKIAGKTIYVNNYLNSNIDDEDEELDESNLNEVENNTLSPNMQKQFNMIVSALKRAKSQEDIDQVHSNLMLLPKKLTKIFIDKLVNMGLANREGEGKYSLDYDDGLDESKLDEGKVKNQYVVKDEEESDEYGDFYVIDKKKAFEYLKQFNSKEASAKQFIKDDEGWGEFEQYLEDVELMSDKELEDAMREDMSMYFFSNPDELGESK